MAAQYVASEAARAYQHCPVPSLWRHPCSAAGAACALGWCSGLLHDVTQELTHSCVRSHPKMTNLREDFRYMPQVCAPAARLAAHSGWTAAASAAGQTPRWGERSMALPGQAQGPPPGSGACFHAWPAAAAGWHQRRAAVPAVAGVSRWQRALQGSGLDRCASPAACCPAPLRLRERHLWCPCTACRTSQPGAQVWRQGMCQALAAPESSSQCEPKCLSRVCPCRWSPRQSSTRPRQTAWSSAPPAALIPDAPSWRNACPARLLPALQLPAASGRGLLGLLAAVSIFL